LVPVQAGLLGGVYLEDHAPNEVRRFTREVGIRTEPSTLRL
jgi:hypothetical protein